MNADAFDALTRAAGPSPNRRAALKAVGAAATGALLAAPLGAEARKRGKKRGNKRRRRCNREKRQCRGAARAFCEEERQDVEECLGFLLPCCDTCKVKTTLVCILEFAG